MRVVTRNLIAIGEMCVIISNTHETLLWDTGLGYIKSYVKKPSTLVNSVLQYVIMIWVYSEQDT